MYAWWQTSGALPGVPAEPHPSESLELLYVGIASNLRKRLAKHHRGAIGSSTLRLTLTALLWERGWRPTWTDRPKISNENLDALAAWQREHLRVQWVAFPEPGAVERDIVEAMRPPLNRDFNEKHPFHEEVGRTRARLRDAARSGRFDPLSG